MLLVISDLHGGTRKDIGRTNENRISDLVGEFLRLVHSGQLLPSRLFDTELIQKLRELESVFASIDHQGAGTEDVASITEQRQGKILGLLTSDRNDNTVRLFELVYIQDTLHRQLLEVELVRLIVIGGDGLRVIVDHDARNTLFFQSSGSANGAVIEFYRATDSVGSRAEDDGSNLARFDVIGTIVVGHVKIVGLGGELGGQGIDLLDNREDTKLLTVGTDLELLAIDQIADVGIREAQNLRLPNFRG